MAKIPSKQPINVARDTENSQEQPGSKIQRRAQKHVKASPKTRSSNPRSIIRRAQIRRKVLRNKTEEERSKHFRPHRTFRRSYREDYQRQTNTPGLLSHAMLTFQTFFKNWRVFVPLVLLIVAAYVLGVGLMSPSVYQATQDTIDSAGLELAGGEIGNFAKAGLLLLATITTGGLDSGMGEAQILVTVLLFLVLWLVTLFLLRRLLHGEHPRLRDGLYNALGPLIPTLVIFVIIFIEAIPIFLLIIAYSAALATDFLAEPFYALIFFIFACLMLLLSGYLISNSLMALVAVTAPGVYPIPAISAATDLMNGRKVKLIIRLIYLIFVGTICFIIFMMPIILIDLWLKSIWEFLNNWPIVPFFLLLMTCFIAVYATIYIYLYYRWLLENEEVKPSE